MRDLGLANSFRVGSRDEHVRGSRSALDTPPLFELACATRALAYMAAVGPITREMLLHLSPGIPVQRTCAVLDRYADAGVLVAFHGLTAFRMNPRVWGLNNRHTSYGSFVKLCRALWSHSVRQHFKVAPPSGLIVPSSVTSVRSGGPAIYCRERQNNIGRILHFLAEMRSPVLQSVARRLLGSPLRLELRVSLLVAYGLIKEDHQHRDRFLSLNFDHPVVPPLRAWLCHLNRVSFPEYGEAAAEYRRQAKAGEHTWAARVIAGRKKRLVR